MTDAMLQWIASQHEAMIAQTESWSRINSGSYHLAGLARMADALEKAFSELGGSIERLGLPPLEVVKSRGEVTSIPVGQALRIRVRPEAPMQVFLGGHMDTVFAEDHPFQTPRRINASTLNGPGVADLKGGLVVMLTALKALEMQPEKNHIGYEIIINPDEEIGSQSSDHLFITAAKQNRLGMIYEPALADGTFAGARKGSGNFTLVIRGKAAHAGREFDKGENAIVTAAELSLALHRLNGLRDGVTINLGKVEGGGPLNMVPDLCLLRLNVRIPDEAARAWVENQLGEALSPYGDKVRLHGKFTRAPKPMSEANRTLFAFVKETGAQLGQDVRWQPTGGCCDGNNLWAHGLPNIDTLGVRGGAIHSSDEFCLLDSLVERAQLSALILTRLMCGECPVSCT